MKIKKLSQLHDFIYNLGFHNHDAKFRQTTIEHVKVQTNAFNHVDDIIRVQLSGLNEYLDSFGDFINPKLKIRVSELDYNVGGYLKKDMSELGVDINHLQSIAHEMGHYVDYSLDCLSDQDEFKKYVDEFKEVFLQQNPVNEVHEQFNNIFAHPQRADSRMLEYYQYANDPHEIFARLYDINTIELHKDMNHRLFKMTESEYYKAASVVYENNKEELQEYFHEHTVVGTLTNEDFKSLNDVLQL